MNKIGAFDLSLEMGRNARVIKMDIFTDSKNTIVRLDCACCPELLASKLPGGVIIPIASTLMMFFENLEMRNLEVNVDRDANIMERVYQGILDKNSFKDMKKKLTEAIQQFNNKRQS